MMPIVAKQNDLMSTAAMLGLHSLVPSVIRPVLVRSGTFSTRMVTNEKQKKNEHTNT